MVNEGKWVNEKGLGVWEWMRQEAPVWKKKFTFHFTESARKTILGTYLDHFFTIK